ncbi:MAG: DNA repair protein RecN [Fimbriimonadaceae bacterium]|nr:DNA repair protein RecN [Fimbriimonadaceae bacterium]
MVLELTVENVAIIDRAEIRLGGGFTVLTGETGAGKSLLVDAIQLALGERADTELIRTGADRAIVRVVVEIDSAVRAKLGDAGIEAPNARLTLQREVLASGRSLCRANGQSVPVATLRGIGKWLVDLHGQHDHQSLLDPERHLGLLDDWIGEPAAALLEETAEVFARRNDLDRRLRNLKAHLRDREQRLDTLRYQVEEIEAIAPQSGELATLESELGRLRNFERLTALGASASERLASGETNARDLLGESVRSLEEAERLDPALAEVLDPLRTALYSLEDGDRALGAYLERLEGDPERLETVAGRIDSLRRLCRKYGDDENAVLEHLERARQEAAELEDGESTTETLAAQLDEAQRILQDVCRRLTEMRRERAAEFATHVEHQLKDLDMERARFEVAVLPREPEATGADRVEFLFSANLGEEPKPLGKIASGGELSRVMLAIKSAMAGRAGVPTLVFDEVDTGLGGRAAAKVARKLEELSRHYQVVVISHLPPIAARASTHFRIEKREQGGRVVTDVRLLGPRERIEEVARMLVGDRLTESALQNARDLLEDADPDPGARLADRWAE